MTNRIQRYILLLLAFFLTATTVTPQHHQATPDIKGAVLLPGLGDLHHTVSTKVPEAQRFFDQGLTLVYAFNREEAIRSFRRAAELDPELAMAHWGVGLALGPYINLGIGPLRQKVAYDAVQKAVALAPNASDIERAYIAALSKRYSDNPKADFKQLAIDYKDAMRELSTRHPNDLDATTLYAESIMVLRPWSYWKADGGPEEGTREMLSVLESVLKRDPKHIGANHYYIHAVEQSPHPERGMASAIRLKTLVPMAGHLVHMPSHIFMRVGDYHAAALSNKAAVEADRAYFEVVGAQGSYGVQYYAHNLQYLAVAHSMEGRFEDALKATQQLEENLAPRVSLDPSLDALMFNSHLVRVRFHKWDEILKSTAPNEKLAITNAIWHFARGMAYCGVGKVGEAEAEVRALDGAAAAINPDLIISANTARSILKIAGLVLAARIEGAKQNKRASIELFRKAVQAEDALEYSEPPDWYIPVRESLGGALMSNGEYEEAERVFRADLEKNRRNGRSLFGLVECLKRRGKKADAQSAQREFESAWKYADSNLRAQDL